jgi:glycosyltransferase involved in cell wall biosynthesis
VNERLNIKIAKTDQTIKLLRERLQTQRSRIEQLAQIAARYSTNGPTNGILRFARQAYEAAEVLRAEVHIAHGVPALPAADMVARTTGGRLICDVIEIPSFVGRCRWHPTNLAFLDLAFESYLRRCDGLLTVGWALKGEIEQYGPPVHVIPNYRRAESLVPSTRLRERCGLGPGDVLLLMLSSNASGMEAVIESLLLLPPNLHLAVVGWIVPAAYRERILALVREHGLEPRFHLFGPVPYDELTGTASGADLGLIVRDPAIPNNRVSLPNRIFDYMFSGLPVCCPDIADISRILREREMGVVVTRPDAQGWAGAIMAALARKEEMRVNALAASREMVWERLEEPLHEALGRPSSVTYFGYNDLTRNNRTLRMAASLAKRGTAVTICTYSDGPPPAMPGDVRFHLLRHDQPAAGGSP